MNLYSLIISEKSAAGLLLATHRSSLKTIESFIEKDLSNSVENRRIVRNYCH